MIVRRASDRARGLIQAFEGLRLEPYQDEAGYWSNGYGHLYRIGEDHTSITQTVALSYFDTDMLQAEAAVCRLIRVPLTDGQYGALVAFCFNLGGGALQRSCLRAKVNRGEHSETVGEFYRWVWAGGHVSAGLVKRRAAEAALYQDDTP